MMVSSDVVLKSNNLFARHHETCGSLM